MLLRCSTLLLLISLVLFCLADKTKIKTSRDLRLDGNLRFSRFFPKATRLLISSSKSENNIRNFDGKPPIFRNDFKDGWIARRLARLDPSEDVQKLDSQSLTRVKRIPTWGRPRPRPRMYGHSHFHPQPQLHRSLHAPHPHPHRPRHLPHRHLHG